MNIDHITLRKLRGIYRLSLAEMAALLDVSESHLCRVEKGERSVNDGMKRMCYSAFELTPEKLALLLAFHDMTNVKGAAI